MFKGVSLSSGGYYTSIFDDAIRRQGDLGYYACRSPDQECVVIALSRKINISLALEQIEQRRREFMAEMKLPCDAKCCYQDCQGHRGCIRVNFLPQVVIDDFKKSHALVLRYRCVDFGQTVLMDQLAKHYYIAVPTAYRVFVSLITLVDWLIRLRLVVPLSTDNLIIDLSSAFVTMLDWSKVKIQQDLSLDAIVAYYQDVARIVKQLAGAQPDGFNWRTPIPAEDRVLLRLFDLLQKIIDFDLSLPDDTCTVMDCIISLQEQRDYLIPRVMNFLIDADLEPGQPPYQLASRKRKEG